MDKMEKREKKQEQRLIMILIAIFILFVIITLSTKCCSSFYQEPVTTKDSSRPIVVTESSCWWGLSNGTFSVETKKYGLICKGNSYPNYSDAYNNPLVLESKGEKIIIHLNASMEETVKMNPKSEQCIKCSSGSSLTYIYVKLK